jgi:hypothetical protein
MTSSTLEKGVFSEVSSGETSTKAASRSCITLSYGEHF